MATSQRLELDPGLIEEIAARLTDAIVTRVVEVVRREGLTPQASQPTAWLDKEVAHKLGLECDWVYEHANELDAAYADSVYAMHSRHSRSSVARWTWSTGGAMGTSMTERAFVNLQLEPAALAEIAGCDSCDHAREQTSAIIDSAPRLRKRFPEHVVGSRNRRAKCEPVAGLADHRKEAAT
jgi:hypothetical protein